MSVLFAWTAVADDATFDLDPALVGTLDKELDRALSAQPEALEAFEAAHVAGYGLRITDTTLRYNGVTHGTQSLDARLAEILRRKNAPVLSGDTQKVAQNMIREVQDAADLGAATTAGGNYRGAILFLDAKVEIDEGFLWGSVGATTTIMSDDSTEVFSHTFSKLALTRRGQISAYGTLLVLAFIMLYELVRYGAFRRDLASAIQNAHPRAGLAALARNAARPHFRTNFRRTSENLLKEGLTLADSLFVTSETALAQGDFGATREGLEKTLEADKDHPAGLQTMERLGKLEQAHQKLKQARMLAPGEPASALPFFHEARLLNPDLTSTVVTEIAMCEAALANASRAGAPSRSVDEGDDETAIALKPERSASLRTGNHAPYLALEGLDRALAKLGDEDASKPQQVRLETERKALLGTMGFSGDAVLDGPWGRVWLHRGDALTLGRAHKRETADVAVRHPRVSRPSRQTRLLRRSDAFWVEDLGSSNGTMVGQQQVLPGTPVRLADESELSLGGRREPPARGSCRFTMRRGDTAPGTPGSLVLTVHSSAHDISDTAVELWADREEASRNVHVLMGGSLALSDNSTMPIICRGDARPPAAHIKCTNAGFTIEATGKEALTLDGHGFCGAVPLEDGAAVSIGALKFTCAQARGGVS